MSSSSKNKDKKHLRQLSLSDFTLYSGDLLDNPLSIGVLMTCDPSTTESGLEDFESIREYLIAKAKGNALFQYQLLHAPMRLDFPYWIPARYIDFHHHIRHLALPKPGTWEELCELVCDLNLRPMDHHRPGWEIYIIDGLDSVKDLPKGSFAVFGRFHHAFVDGKSVLKMIEYLLGKSPEVELPAPIKMPKPPTPFDLWTNSMPHLWEQSVDATRASFAAVKKSYNLFSQLIGENRPEQLGIPKTMFSADLSLKRVWGAVEWEFVELKKLRSLHKGASFNDVMVAIIAGGMRRYLLKHNDLPKDKSLVAMCPVALSAKAGSDVEGGDVGGNYVAMMLIAIGTNIENPIERLKAINRRVARAKPIAPVLNDLFATISKMRPVYVRKIMQKIMPARDHHRDFSAGQNTNITNVPGLMGRPRYFAGSEVRGLYPVVPLPGEGIVHGITGLNTTITIGVLADGEVMKDMDFYLQCLEESRKEYQGLL